MKKKPVKKIVKHLKDDIETFKEEANEDKELIRSLSGEKKKKESKCPKSKKQKHPKNKKK